MFTDISMGGHIANYTKNALYEWGTHSDTDQRYHPDFDNPDWFGYEEGVSTEWGKGTFQELINHGHRALGTRAGHNNHFFAKFI